MAGHSKWANIRYRKQGQDAKRGKLFTKLIREITVAARNGGDDLTSNPQLRTAVDKAYASNMTKDTIERAIKRGAGNEDGQNLEAARYEGYGPNGVAVMVDCLTDNRNRTVAEVRHAFSKHGGSMGTSGSVSYLFNKIGRIIVKLNNKQSLDQLMEAAIDAGAEEVENLTDNEVEVQTAPDDLTTVKTALQELQFDIILGESTLSASTYIALDVTAAETIVKLIDRLEDLDDVQTVYTNADFPDEMLSE